MRRHIAMLSVCVAVLHSADGNEIRVDVHQIAVQRAAVSEHARRQLHHAVHSVITAGGEKFGVIETLDQIHQAMEHCLDGEHQ